MAISGLGDQWAIRDCGAYVATLVAAQRQSRRTLPQHHACRPSLLQAAFAPTASWAGPGRAYIMSAVRNAAAAGGPPTLFVPFTVRQQRPTFRPNSIPTVSITTFGRLQSFVAASRSAKFRAFSVCSRPSPATPGPSRCVVLQRQQHLPLVSHPSLLPLLPLLSPHRLIESSSAYLRGVPDPSGSPTTSEQCLGNTRPPPPMRLRRRWDWRPRRVNGPRGVQACREPPERRVGRHARGENNVAWAGLL